MKTKVQGVLIYICPKCNEVVKERWNKKDFYECDYCTFSFNINDGIPDNLILDEGNL